VPLLAGQTPCPRDQPGLPGLDPTLRGSKYLEKTPEFQQWDPNPVNPVNPVDHGPRTPRHGTLLEFFAQPSPAARTAGTGEADPVAWLEGLLAALGAQQYGRKWACPAHALNAKPGAHSLSLTVNRADDGRALVHCHGNAGCDFRDVLRALKLPHSALTVAPPVEPARYARAYLPGVRFPAPRIDRGPGPGWVAVSIDRHPYGDPPIAWKIRERSAAGDKRITWESLNSKGERVPGLLGRKETELGMYQARQVRMAMAMDEVIVLCESESSVDAMAKAGVYGTCWPGGAGTAPTEQMAALFNDYDRVVLIPDFDDAGLDVAERICKVLPVRVVLGEPGEDARDLLKRLGPTEFRALVEGTEP
jgi:hypothetical protein